MRFCIGKVPPNVDFRPEDDGWQRLQEPEAKAFLVQAVAVGVMAAMAVNYLVVNLPGTDPGRESIVIRTGDLTAASVAIGLAAIVGSFVALILVHESIHLIAHPGLGRTRHSILGVLPKVLVFYAFYDSELTRNRFVVMVAAPFICITVVPIVVFACLGQPPIWVALFMIVNALVSGGDLVAIWLVLKQVPKNAVVRHQSWDAYWKPIQ